MAEKKANALDINGPNFNPDLYLEKLFKVPNLKTTNKHPLIYVLLKESSLRQVMDHESEIVKDTQTLHSDMQTLVYENYNKFISATDTIRKVSSCLVFASQIVALFSVR